MARIKNEVKNGASDGVTGMAIEPKDDIDSQRDASKNAIEMLSKGFGRIVQFLVIGSGWITHKQNIS